MEDVSQRYRDREQATVDRFERWYKEHNPLIQAAVAEAAVALAERYATELPSDYQWVDFSSGRVACWPIVKLLNSDEYLSLLPSGQLIYTSSLPVEKAELGYGPSVYAYKRVANPEEIQGDDTRDDLFRVHVNLLNKLDKPGDDAQEKRLRTYTDIYGKDISESHFNVT